MNERQIRKIRKQFILISTLSFSGVMLLMGGIIYGFSEHTLRNEVRQIMSYIVEHENELSALPQDSLEENSSLQTESTDSSEQIRPLENESDSALIEWSLPKIFGREGLYDNTLDYIRTTSFFAVLFDEEEQVLHVTMNLMLDMDEQQVIRYALRAKHRMLGFGNVGRYYYNVLQQEDGTVMVIYVDRTGQVAVNNRILFVVLILLGTGTLLAFFLMRVLSMRVVRTEVENADRQKKFITNASHELKTPLAVIRANTEMQEMMEGETEWTASTLRQVERMSGLVENLVKIARAGENETLQMAQVNITQIAAETADSFRAVAASDEKKLETEITDPLTAITDESAIRQLLTLLLDNAVKYCDPQGTIRCGARKNGKTLELWVSNAYAEGATVDYRRFFDRFYREDASHNTEKGGYGIGLSIAESLVKSFHGKLDVSWKDGFITFKALLPEGRLISV